MTVIRGRSPWAVGALVLMTLGALGSPRATATVGAGPVRHVSQRQPVLGPSRDLGATRDVADAAAPTAPGVAPDAHPWQLRATIPGAVIHDISFASPRIGFAAAELGQVWRTVDGGTTWTEVLNLGYPYYWYGVDALDPTNVVISGFDNSNWRGILRWSHDGGTTWSDDLVVTTDGWSNRVRFVNRRDGLVVGLVSLDSANETQYTTDGGGTEQDWTTVVPDPDGGWFGADFAFLSSGRAYISGITECFSPTGGAAWSCRPSVDPVFDGAVEFVDRRHGWVGGGEISPNVEGWVHVTTDGGQTWSGRTLNSPWPIRELHFLTASTGWAAGGNLYSNLGGMYFSADGGQTWSLDADTGAEMSSCAHLVSGPRVRVWCAGYAGSFSGVIYSLSTSLPPAH